MEQRIQEAIDPKPDASGQSAVHSWLIGSTAIPLQNATQEKQDDFRERTLFYWAKLYASSLEKGQLYQNLKKAIAINILDYTLFENREQYHTEVVAALRDTHEIFSDKFSIHYAAETRGKAKNLVDDVSKFMKGTGKSLEEVLAILEVSQSEYDQSLALLNQ